MTGFGAFCLIFGKKTCKKGQRFIKNILTLAHFSRIIDTMERKLATTWKIVLLRIVLTLACLLTFAWIFSNSLQTGEQSSQTSHTVTDTVQEVASVIAPSSPIATATGEDYERLHNDVRTIAHFLEFAFLGALLIFCYYSYTNSSALLILPLGLIFLTPIVDEYLQSFVGGRGTELKDVLIDTAGGFAGAAFAAIVLVIGYLIIKKKRA